MVVFVCCCFVFVFLHYIVLKLKLPVYKAIRKDSLPLCCPKGEVFDEVKCIIPPSNFNWAPKLDGAHKASFYYNGFPKCERKRDFIETYQREVHFSQLDGKVFLPFYVRLSPLDKDEYCVTKVYDSSDLSP
ncbi:UNVERIFIED_CONTAM: hypothetical protein RMT77_004953, partial [Armadillidium vulgare]